ncbi:MAG: hypothetical protein WKI04_00525 [Ferruginibacter sp.]
MRTIRSLIILSIIFFSCKKNENKSTNNDTEDIITRLKGKWHLTSETRSGSYDHSTYEGIPSDYIEFMADGKVNSRIQGQWGLIFDYQLDAPNKTILFQYVTTHPIFLTTQPCNSNLGCLKIAHVKFISDKILVLGNTFSDTKNGVLNTLTITDSLSK